MADFLFGGCNCRRAYAGSEMQSAWAMAPWQGWGKDGNPFGPIYTQIIQRWHFRDNPRTLQKTSIYDRISDCTTYIYDPPLPMPPTIRSGDTFAPYFTDDWLYASIGGTLHNYFPVYPSGEKKFWAAAPNSDAGWSESILETFFLDPFPLSEALNTALALLGQIDLLRPDRLYRCESFFSIPHDPQQSELVSFGYPSDPVGQGAIRRSIDMGRIIQHFNGPDNNSLSAIKPVPIPPASYYCTISAGESGYAPGNGVIGSSLAQNGNPFPGSVWVTKTAVRSDRQADAFAVFTPDPITGLFRESFVFPGPASGELIFLPADAPFAGFIKSSSYPH